jgi:hypothetical protein
MAMASPASAGEIHRSNWVPNVGLLFEFPNGDSDEDEDEQPLGDMWTFNCPSGGIVFASVDTNTDQGTSDIDPVPLVVDGAGNALIFGDDELACTYPPVCGFRCPAVQANCGTGRRHSLIVRDEGKPVPAGRVPCQEGGGYELTVEVFNANEGQVSASNVNLGGGPQRNVPGGRLRGGQRHVHRSRQRGLSTSHLRRCGAKCGLLCLTHFKAVV